MNINININFGDRTAEAVNNLADAIKSLTGLNFATDNLIKTAEEKVEKAVTGKSSKGAKDKTSQGIRKEPIKEPEKTPEVTEVKTEGTKNADVEDTSDLNGLDLGAEVTYSADELRKATADLANLNADSRTGVLNLLREKYNVKGFNDIDSSRYGEYATDIRALGANV